MSFLLLLLVLFCYHCNATLVVDVEVPMKTMQTRTMFPVVADVEANTVIYSFGSTPSSKMQFANDVVVFGPLLGFITLTTTEEVPVRAEHMAAVFNNTYFVAFGGVNGSPLHDIWALDLAWLKWSRVDPSVCRESSTFLGCPLPRYAAAFTTIKTGNYANSLIFTGGRSNEILSDTWLFDLVSYQYTQLNATGLIPPAMMNSLLVFHENAVYLLGGRESISSINSFNSIYVLDLSSLVWSVISVTLFGLTFPINFAQVVGDIYQNFVFLLSAGSSISYKVNLINGVITELGLTNSGGTSLGGAAFLHERFYAFGDAEAFPMSFSSINALDNSVSKNFIPGSIDLFLLQMGVLGDQLLVYGGAYGRNTGYAFNTLTATWRVADFGLSELPRISGYSMIYIHGGYLPCSNPFYCRSADVYRISLSNNSDSTTFDLVKITANLTGDLVFAKGGHFGALMYSPNGVPYMINFGGFGDHYADYRSSDLTALNLDSLDYTNVHIDSRDGSWGGYETFQNCVAAVNGRLWTFGGDCGNNSPQSDVLQSYLPAFDFDGRILSRAGTWTTLFDFNVRPTIGPSARALMSCTSLQNRYFLVFGGSAYGITFNELWAFDTFNSIWKLLNTATVLSGRNGAAMLLFENKFFCFGGGGSSFILGALSDVVVNPSIGSDYLCYINPSFPCKTIKNALSRYQAFNGLEQNFNISSGAYLKENEIIVTNPVNIQTSNFDNEFIMWDCDGHRCISFIGANAVASLVRNIKFFNGKSASSGGIIFSSFSSVNIISCIFIDSIGIKGGAIAIIEQSLVSISSSTFSNLISSEFGGAIYCQTSSLSISSSNLFDNIVNSTSAGAGGAICSFSCVVNVVNCELSNNKALIPKESRSVSYGGALYAFSSVLNLINSSFFRNFAENGGSVAWFSYFCFILVYVSRGTTDIDSSSLTYLGETSVSSKYSSYVNNSAVYGGAIYLESLPISNFENDVIHSNSASRDGGGVYVLNCFSGSIKFVYSLVMFNGAYNNAGGICSIESSISIYGGLITSNSATAGGGGIYWTRENKNQLQLAPVFSINPVCYTSRYVFTRDFYEYFPNFVADVSALDGIVFSVIAKNDALVLLNSNSWEIVLGGSNNLRSVIRQGKGGPEVAFFDGAILNQLAPTTFWVNWVGDFLKVGLGHLVGSNEIMSVNLVDETQIKYVYVSTGFGSSGDWKFCLSNLRSCIINTKSYFDFSTNKVGIISEISSFSFRFASSSDACLALGNIESHFVQLCISKLNITVTVSNTIIATSDINFNSLFSPTFWLRWDQGSLLLGLGKDVLENSILTANLADYQNLLYEYLYISTRDSVGSWEFLDCDRFQSLGGYEIIIGDNSNIVSNLALYGKDKATAGTSLFWQNINLLNSTQVSGAVTSSRPVVSLLDEYGNIVKSDSHTIITALPQNSWTGTFVQILSEGTIEFDDLILTAEPNSTSSLYFGGISKDVSPTELKFINVQLCDVGEYLSGSICLKCSAGSFTNETMRIECSLCSPGHFSTSGQSSCSNCEPGKFNAQSGQSTCFSCGLGYATAEFSSTTCSQCLPGTFSAAENQVLCSNCPIGWYNVDVGSIVCLPCSIGLFNNISGSSFCQVCSAGTFQSLMNSSTCESCNEGFYSTAGQSACAACSIGYFAAPGSSSCDACSSGRFSNTSESSSCSKCSIGTFSSTTASTVCTICNVGSFSNSTGLTICQFCNAGTVAPASGMSYCNFCDLGEYIDKEAQSQCLKCPLGTFNDKLGVSVCSLCSRGSVQAGEGSVSCNPCSPGYFIGSEGKLDCIACPIGTFSGNFSSTTCVNCAPGSFQSTQGQSACQLCSPGRYSRSDGKGDCSICDVGTYSDLFGLTSCSLCLPGSFQDLLDKSSCSSCSPGFFSSEGQSICTPCPAGSYSNISGSTECTKCSAGTFQTDSGLTSCLFSAIGSYVVNEGALAMTPCPAGKFSSLNASTSCLPCDVGSFSIIEGATACLLCPSGSISTSIGSLTCTLCESGFYSNSSGFSACLQCDAGTFSNESGKSTCEFCSNGTFSSYRRSTTCATCESGTFSLLGFSSCVDCDSGTWSLLGASFCNRCAAGKSSSAKSSQCYDCAAGTYSTSTSSSCLACPAGSFAPNTVSSSCSLCSVSTFSTSSSPYCMNCPAGTFSNSTGSGECLLCNAPYFSDEGSTSCKQCPLTQIATNKTKSIGCVSCPVGYIPDDEQILCVLCPKGMYMPLGSIACILVPEFFVRDGLDETKLLDTSVIDSSLSFTIYSIAGGGIFITTLMLVLILYHRDKRVVFSASTKFLCIILFGMMFVYGAAMCYSTTQTVLLCELKNWLLVFGANMIFVSIFAKSWRLDRIFNPDGLKIFRYTDFYLFLVILPIYIYDAIILLVHLILHPYTLVSPIIHECKAPYIELYLYLIWVPKGVVLIYGLYIAWKIRNIEDSFNESKYIAACVWHLGIAALGVILMQLLFGYMLRNVTIFIIGSVAAMFVMIVTLVLIFVPKIMEVYYPEMSTSTGRHSRTKSANQVTLQSPNKFSSPTNKGKATPKASKLVKRNSIEIPTEKEKVTALEKEFATKKAKQERDKADLAAILKNLNSLREDIMFKGHSFSETSMSSSTPKISLNSPIESALFTKNPLYDNHHLKTIQSEGSALNINPIFSPDHVYRNNSAGSPESVVEMNVNQTAVTNEYSRRDSNVTGIDFDPNCFSASKTGLSRRKSKAIIESPGNYNNTNNEFDDAAEWDNTSRNTDLDPRTPIPGENSAI